MIDPFTIKFNEVVWHDRPFHHHISGKLVKKDFYNRVSIKTEAENILFSDSPTPIIIQGERRSGKTSLLRLLESHMENDPSGQWVPLHIPYMGIHSCQSLFNEIIFQLGSKFDLEFKDKTAPGNSPPPNEPTVSSFISTLRNALAGVKYKTIVICIDEFDLILEDQEIPDIEKNKIIGFINELIEQTDIQIKLLLTLSRLLDRYEIARRSPLTSKSRVFRLIPFTNAEMNEMVCDIMGNQYSLPPEDFERIYNLSGGWPYFIKLLMYYMAQQPGISPVWSRLLELALEDISVQRAIENIYFAHFNDDEKKVVLLLSKYAGNFKNNNLEFLDEKEKEAFTELCERHFLERTEDGNYGFAVGFLKDWFPRWIKFKGEADSRIKDILGRLTCTKDSWFSTPAVEVTEEDRIKYKLP